MGVRGRGSIAIRLAAGAAILACAVVPGSAQDRTLSFKQMHTGETLTVTYMRNGRHDAQAMRRISHILRDWRRNESTAIDPKLIDLIWDIRRQTGSQAAVHVLSAYRSPVTNAALRARSSGVAENSQHTTGRAIDFYLPDVPLARLREAALRAHGGGVGYYPGSGSPFVHLDTGSVRHWPRLPRQQLARVFPDGRTTHIPSDGKPMEGYQAALAQARSTATASTSGGRQGIAFWRRDESDPSAASAGGSGGLLAGLFSRDSQTPQAQPPRPAPAAPPQAVAQAPAPAPAQPPAPAAAQVAEPVPLPPARPVMESHPPTLAASAPLPRARPDTPPPAQPAPPMLASGPVPLPAPRPAVEAPVMATLAVLRPPSDLSALSPAAQEAARALAPADSLLDRLPFADTFVDSPLRRGDGSPLEGLDTRPGALRTLLVPESAMRGVAMAAMHHPDSGESGALIAGGWTGGTRAALSPAAAPATPERIAMAARFEPRTGGAGDVPAPAAGDSLIARAGDFLLSFLR